jgi:hypothetical protein
MYDMPVPEHRQLRLRCRSRTIYFDNFADCAACKSLPPLFWDRAKNSDQHVCRHWLRGLQAADTRRRMTLREALGGRRWFSEEHATAIETHCTWTCTSILVMVARIGMEARRTLRCCQGRHNSRNHNHLDVGNVIVYRDSKPILSGCWGRQLHLKTFDVKTRYTIWTMHGQPTTTCL